MISDWMQTHTGKMFYPLEPRIDDIDLADIAHALSLLCRYGGHTKKFYSVAEHSVLMSELNICVHPLWALLHDAAEAYLCDIPRPIKQSIPEYKKYENRLLDMIGEKFELGLYPADEIHKYDSMMMAVEKRDILAKNIQWGTILPEPEDKIFATGWSWDKAEYCFLHRLNILS
jgi:hypothetical protein